MSHQQKHPPPNQQRPLPIRNVATQSDYMELKKAFTFLPPPQPPPTKTTTSTIIGTESTNTRRCISSKDIVDNNHNDKTCKNNNKNPSPSNNVNTVNNNADDDINFHTTWQERMVIKYHSHLYKSHVIADFSRQTKDNPNNIGLRWRVKSEVKNGRGFDTCGNKHCLCYYEDREQLTFGVRDEDFLKGFQNDNIIMKTSKKRSIEDVIRWKLEANNRKLLYEYEQKIVHDDKQHQQQSQYEQEQREKERIQQVPHGLGLFDYTVHFQYVEHNQSKEELVQLKLCLRCAPKLFHQKGGALGALRARRESENMSARSPSDKVDKHFQSHIGTCNDEEKLSDNDSSTSSSQEDVAKQRKRNKRNIEHQKKERKYKRKKHHKGIV